MDVVAEDKLSSPFVTKCGQGAIIINFLQPDVAALISYRLELHIILMSHRLHS